MVVASGLLALVVGAAFAVLLSSVADLRGSERRARQSEQVLVVANRLERIVVDLESGQRGFLITHQEEVLQPWRDAQVAFPEQAATLERLVAGNPEQRARAQRIAQAGTSYIRDYSVPLVNAARRDPAAARSVAATDEGRRRIDAIRVEFDRFVATERDLAAARQRRSEAADRRSVVPVELDVDVQTRLPDQVEVAAYYVVSEALANAAKHARASVAHIDIQADDGMLHLSVRDDGVGGAAPGRGSGLIGLTDRVEALGGTISVTSPTGGGTALRVDLPIKGP